MKRALPILILSSACAAPDSDIWYPPTDSGGKADAFSTINGNDIPSGFADANKSYIISRRIDSLQMAGALDMVESRLAQRIDGIIANMPADGRLHLAELVRMEDPQIHASLFADEVAALPRLWTKVEAPSANDLVVGPDVAFGVLDTSTVPGPAVVPASLAINTLATPEMQAAASRLENLFNNDSNTATVALPDVDNGLNNPNAFLPAEITQFNALKALFKQLAVANATAQLSVSPSPGAFNLDATLGPGAIHMAGTTKYEEDRQMQSTSQLTTRLTATQAQKATVNMAADAKVIVIAKDTQAETVFGDAATPAVGGPVVFEVWKANQRIFSTNAVLPPLTKTLTLDLSDKLDYTLKGALAPLVKNVATATFNGNSAVHYTYDKTIVAPTGPVDQTAVQRTTSPTIKLPVGRYTIPQANIVVNIYSNNVIWVSRSGSSFRLLPIANNTPTPTVLYNQQMQVTFDTANNQLFISNPSFQAVLTASMRDI